MFILTSLTLPLAFLTTFSRIGVSCLQGPHQGAQKSISTGWRFDSSITSFMKPWVVVSLTRPSGAAAAATPPPLSNIVMCSSPGTRNRPGLPPTSVVFPSLNGPEKPQLQSGSGVRKRPGDRDNPGLVTGRLKEFQQVRAGDRCGHGVDQGMRVDGRKRHQFGVEHDPDAARLVVDRAKRCHRAGLDAERLAHQL